MGNIQMLSMGSDSSGMEFSEAQCIFNEENKIVHYFIPPIAIIGQHNERIWQLISMNAIGRKGSMVLANILEQFQEDLLLNPNHQIYSL